MRSSIARFLVLAVIMPFTQCAIAVITVAKS